MPRSSPVEAEIDALYALRPGEFVEARDALARRLRHEGRRAEADAVKALTRPTAAAWAVNQLPRREPEWTQALVTAGRRLVEAHERLLETGDRAGWRETLQAATLDPEAREAVAAGRLARELRPPGLPPAGARAERARRLAAEALAEARQLERERAAALEAAERARAEAARALEEREQAVAEARAAFERARGPAEPG